MKLNYHAIYCYDCGELFTVLSHDHSDEYGDIIRYECKKCGFKQKVGLRRPLTYLELRDKLGVLIDKGLGEEPAEISLSDMDTDNLSGTGYGIGVIGYITDVDDDSLLGVWTVTESES